jgi:hypothetical protein
MVKPKAHFEQVPIETVKQIAKLDDLAELVEIHARSMKKKRQIARGVSEKPVVPGRIE